MPSGMISQLFPNQTLKFGKVVWYLLQAGQKLKFNNFSTKAWLQSLFTKRKAIYSTFHNSTSDFYKFNGSSRTPTTSWWDDTWIHGRGHSHQQQALFLEQIPREARNKARVFIVSFRTNVSLVAWKRSTFSATFLSKAAAYPHAHHAVDCF